MRARVPSTSPAWAPDFAPPEPLRAGDWHLTPLGPGLTEVDYQAWRSCRERLVRELDWNGWPGAAFTLQENHADLAEHYREFLAREAYAYSVLSGERCVGCLYLEPWSTGAQLAFWLVDDWLDRTPEVIAALQAWLEHWPFEAVLWPVRSWNDRKMRALEGLGFTQGPGPAGHVSFSAATGARTDVSDA